jgi:O-antigen/teichoic acid export membrane protein
VKERSLFANSAWGVISNFLRTLVGFAFIPVVTSHLGVEDYGIYAVLLLFSYNFGLGNQIDLGYPNFLVKHVSQFTGQAAFESFNENCGAFNFLLIGLQIILYLALLVAFPTVAYVLKIPVRLLGDFESALIIVLISNVIASYGSVYSSFLMGQHHNAFIKKTETFCYLVFNILAILCVYFKGTFLSIIWIFAFTQVLQSIIFIYAVYALHKSFFKITFSGIGYIRQNWPLWKPFFFSKINGMAFRQTDSTIISFFLGPNFVALYDISMKIPAFFKSTIGRISETFIPFSGARSSDQDRIIIGDILTDLLFFSVGVSLYFSTSVFFYGDKILYSWLGRTPTADIVFALKIASLIPVFTALCSTPAALIMGNSRHVKFITWTPTIISIGNIILSIPLTIHYGFVGTVAATVVQYIVFSLVLLKPIKSDFDVKFKAVIGRILVFLALIIPGHFLIKLLLNGEGSRFGQLAVIILTNGFFGILLLLFYKKTLLSLRKKMTIKASASISQS